MCAPTPALPQRGRGFFFSLEEVEELRTRELPQHRGRQRVGLVVVVDVDVQPVHPVEVRIGEELLERGVPHLGGDVGVDEAGEVAGGGQLVRVFEGRKGLALGAPTLALPQRGRGRKSQAPFPRRRAPSPSGGGLRGPRRKALAFCRGSRQGWGHAWRHLGSLGSNPLPLPHGFLSFRPATKEPVTHPRPRASPWSTPDFRTGPPAS